MFSSEHNILSNAFEDVGKLRSWPPWVSEKISNTSRWDENIPIKWNRCMTLKILISRYINLYWLKNAVPKNAKHADFEYSVLYNVDKKHSWYKKKNLKNKHVFFLRNFSSHDYIYRKKNSGQRRRRQQVGSVLPLHFPNESVKSAIFLSTNVFAQTFIKKFIFMYTFFFGTSATRSPAE